MSGPQGHDPTQAWSGSQPPSDQPAWQPPATPDQPTTAAPAWGQSYPAQPYAGGYQQPGYPATPQYPGADQYGGAGATAVGPTGYGQYGQQPQYGQSAGYGEQPQYGQPAGYGEQPQYGQPGQFAPYGTTSSPSGSKNSMKVILGVVGAVAAVVIIAVAILGFWKPGWFVTTELDINAAQTGVQKVLSDEENGYGAKDVEGVVCNKGQNVVVEDGKTFDCEVSIDGTERTVTVTFQGDDGTYEVGRPR